MRKTILTLLSLLALAVGSEAQNHFGIFRDKDTTIVSHFDKVQADSINARPFSFEADNSWFLYHPENTNWHKYGQSTGTVSVKPEYEAEVSGGKFFYIDSYNSNNPTVYYRLGRNYGRYDIHVVLVPDFYAENNTDTLKHMLQATLAYGYAANGRKTNKSSATFDYDGRSVQDFVLFEDIEFPAYNYAAEKNAFWKSPLDSEDELRILGKNTASYAKKGYGYNLCIDRIYLVPKTADEEAGPGITIYDERGSLAMPKEELQSMQMAYIDFEKVEATVNPVNFADVSIQGSITGMKELWAAGLEPTIGVELTSISTTDAYGNTYETTDMKKLTEDRYSDVIRDDHFANIAPYSEYKISAEDVTFKTDDAVHLSKPLPVLLPNATVGYKLFVEVDGMRIYSEPATFQTPKVKASLLKLKAPQQKAGTYDIHGTFDATELMARMNQVTIPNPKEGIRYTFVDQRNYFGYSYDNPGLGTSQSGWVFNLLGRNIFDVKMFYPYETASESKRFAMTITLPDFSVDSQSNLASSYFRKYTSDDPYYFEDFLRSHGYITYNVEFDDNGPAEPYTTFRFVNPAEAELAGKTLLQELMEDGNFTTYVRLMCDPVVNMGQFLSDNATRTTVFASDDKAWKRFFQQNALLPAKDYWRNATSYDALTVEQRNLLARYSLLTYLYKAEDLTNEPHENKEKGLTMRRANLIEPINQIQPVAAGDVPYTFSLTEKDYWERFRPENGGNGLLLATDSTAAMTFVMDKAYMNKNGITDQDYRIIYGHEPKAGDIYVGESVLREADGVTANGYLNVVSDVIAPRQSMAEVIRTNGQTNIFSHIMDRFSAPFFSQAMTKQYNGEDSVFVKRYFSERSAGGRRLDTEPAPYGTLSYYNPYRDPYSKDIVSLLKFDPAWNGYYDYDTLPEESMASMYVPSDKALWNYFTKASGRSMIHYYYNKVGTANEIPYVKPTSLVELYQQIDRIPLSVMGTMVNNIMMRSFTASVPSKMTKLMDDAMQPIFNYKDIEKIDTCLLASNGAVYVMDGVYGPGDYMSVAAPVYISGNSNIMKWAVYSGSFSGTDYMNGLNYYSYLKAADADLTFFLPTDAAMQYYYDPVSMKSKTPRVISMSYKNNMFPVNCKAYSYYCPYNVGTSTELIGNKGGQIIGNNGAITNDEITNRLKDILESHTIVHDGTNPIHGQDEYFLTKNGTPVKVQRDADGNIIGAKGGFQLENERNGVKGNSPGAANCNITQAYEGLANGQTYALDAPLAPTYRSVWSILTDDMMEESNFNPKGYSEEAWAKNPYSAFYELCAADGYSDLIVGCGLVDAKVYTTKQRRENAMVKFKIFTALNKNGLDYNVQFFSNYNYTVFVPTNEVIQQEIAKGLPTWKEIEKDYNSHCDEDGYLKTAEDSLRIQAKITYLVNFVKYHFMDRSVFIDNSTLAEKDYTSNSYDKEYSTFCWLYVQRPSAGNLQVKDENGGKWLTALAEYNGKDVSNILARDYVCSTQPRDRAMAGITINGASSAVIHLIPGALNHVPLVGGRHDSTWKTPAAAKSYIKRFRLTE